MTGEISFHLQKRRTGAKSTQPDLLPGLEEAAKLSANWSRSEISTLTADRFLGLDCHDLLEITLELCRTPSMCRPISGPLIFSLFGAFSGFDTVEECYGDLSSFIHAVETGLSSDPP